ncbi:MAG: YlxR family protein [Clostridia bacterium]|nr:YlxR family protein [Clostridia bacterium]
MTERKTPLRKCVGCNEMKDKRELVRVVRSSEGAIRFDATGKLPGRGAYICRDPACLAAAIKSKRLERAFKCRVPDDVYETLKKQFSEKPDD